MNGISSVGFSNVTPKISTPINNQKVSFCGEDKPKNSATKKLLGLGALAALGVAAVLLHKSHAAKKAAKQAIENVENLQKSANAEMAAKRSENANNIIDYVENLKKAEKGAEHQKIQVEYEKMSTEYNLAADRQNVLARRAQTADDMIMRVERLKKAEKNGIEHAKRQSEYDNFYIDKSTREDALDPLEFTFSKAGHNNVHIFPNHPFVEFTKGITDKNYQKRAFILKIRNNENVDSFKFIHTDGFKGFIRVNFKDGTSKIAGKYDLNAVNQNQADYDNALKTQILPLIQKYVPESAKYPEEYIKYMFRN